MAKTQELKVLSFKIRYSGLTKEHRDCDPESYYFRLFRAILMEGRKGNKHLKILTANKAGTSITYAPINSEAEASEAKTALISLAKEFNEKYNADIQIKDDEEEKND